MIEVQQYGLGGKRERNGALCRKLKRVTTILAVNFTNQELLLPPPVITLTTDFGLLDHYVGTMKGVILQRCPDARIIDITHGIAPFSILAAAYTINQSAPYFPKGTVHVIVVDPGVGTERKAIVTEALGQSFVGPDNGVFSLIFARDPQARTFEVTNRDLALPNASTTFHGRDLFAPVSAAIASGSILPQEVGSILSNPELLSDLDPVRISELQWAGRILSVDHFGNVITNFRSDSFLPNSPARFELLVGDVLIRKRASTFGEVGPGELFVYPGSSGYFEIGLNRGNAAVFLGIEPSAPLILNL